MFRTRLRELREAAGYKSQQMFADAFGVAQSTVGNWEAGKREPNYEITMRLARFFGVSIDYLLGVEEKSESTPVPEGRLVQPPEYEFLTPVNRGIADRLIADLVKSQSPNVTPLQISAIAQGGGEYDTKADTTITLPKNSTKVRPVQDTAGTDGIPSAPKKT